MSTDLFIFLSHAAKDDSTADAVHRGLIGKGVKCWRDHVDIIAGDNWSRSIETALTNCESGLLLLTPASTSSDACQAEYLTLIESGKILYVAVSGDAAIPWRLRTFQFVFLGASFDQSIEVLATAIKRRRTILRTATPKEVESGLAGTLVPFRRSVVRRVRLVLDMAIDSFKRTADRFTRLIARLLGLDDDDINIIDISPGSTVVTIQLPELAAFQIVEIVELNPHILAEYNIVTITSFPAPVAPVQVEVVRFTGQETPNRKDPDHRSSLDSELVSLQESSFVTFAKLLARCSMPGTASPGMPQLLNIYQALRGIPRGDVESARSILEKFDPRWRK